MSPARRRAHPRSVASSCAPHTSRVGASMSDRRASTAPKSRAWACDHRVRRHSRFANAALAARTTRGRRPVRVGELLAERPLDRGAGHDRCDEAARPRREGPRLPRQVVGAVGVRAREHQAAHACRGRSGEIQGEDAAVAVPHEHRPVDAGHVEERLDGASLSRNRVVAAGFGRSAVTANVERDHVMVAGEQREDRRERGRVARLGMQEHDGRTLAGLEGVQRETVHRAGDRVSADALPAVMGGTARRRPRCPRPRRGTTPCEPPATGLRSAARRPRTAGRRCARRGTR